MPARRSRGITTMCAASVSTRISTTTTIRTITLTVTADRLFDTYVIVDWSAASQPKTGRDSIWICRLGADGESFCNPPTRHAAKGLLADMLAGASARGERVVVGFDFPFGYPAGFAARLGLN